jgi:hypothetical protein
MTSAFCSESSSQADEGCWRENASSRDCSGFVPPIDRDWHVAGRCGRMPQAGRDSTATRLGGTGCGWFGSLVPSITRRPEQMSCLPTSNRTGTGGKPAEAWRWSESYSTDHWPPYRSGREVKRTYCLISALHTVVVLLNLYPVNKFPRVH